MINTHAAFAGYPSRLVIARNVACVHITERVARVTDLVAPFPSTIPQAHHRHDPSVFNNIIAFFTYPVDAPRRASPQRDIDTRTTTPTNLYAAPRTKLRDNIFTRMLYGLYTAENVPYYHPYIKLYKTQGRRV